MRLLQCTLRLVVDSARVGVAVAMVAAVGMVAAAGGTVDNKVQGFKARAQDPLLLAKHDRGRT